MRLQNKIALITGGGKSIFKKRAGRSGAIKRMAEAKGGAAMAIYFASGPSSAMTGQSVSICGGFNMH
jgi:hypothetical protein